MISGVLLPTFKLVERSLLIVTAQLILCAFAMAAEKNQKPGIYDEFILPASGARAVSMGGTDSINGILSVPAVQEALRQANKPPLFQSGANKVAYTNANGAMEQRQGFFRKAFADALNLIYHFDQTLFKVVSTSLKVTLISVLLAALAAVPLGLYLALTPFAGRGIVLSLLNTLMALPTVVVGLLLYGLLNRQGLLGSLSLLYTPTAIVLGQTLLIMPIICNLSIAAARNADPRLPWTCISLGANFPQTALIYISEIRFALIAAIVAGFGRAIGEVGVAMMLGGNIEGFTRTMTTAIALETSKGEFEFALALGIILLLVALAVNTIFQRFQENKK